MNIQPGKLKNTRKPRAARQGSIGEKLFTVFRFAFIIAAVAGLLNSYIYLNQKITETERAIRSTERELTRTEREIAQLRIHRERLCSRPHINAMIARFHLNLVEPAVGQVSHLALLMPDRTATPLQPAVALRTTAGNGGTRRN